MAQKPCLNRAEVAPFWAGVNDLNVEGLLEVEVAEEPDSDEGEGIEDVEVGVDVARA